MLLPKPKKGEHRKMKKREHDSKMETFRIEVMARDRKYICCGVRTELAGNPYLPLPNNRTHFEVAHLVGKGRKPQWKYETFNGIRVSWWFHDWMDKRNDVDEPSADERKILLLHWWEKNDYGYFHDCSWVIPLRELEASVARRKVGT